MSSTGVGFRSSGRCPICQGSGQVTSGGATQASTPLSYRCTHCQGSGWCPTCRGTGYSPSGTGPCPSCHRG
jgi:hypothetical protein